MDKFLKELLMVFLVTMFMVACFDLFKISADIRVIKNHITQQAR